MNKIYMLELSPEEAMTLHDMLCDVEYPLGSIEAAVGMKVIDDIDSQVYSSGDECELDSQCSCCGDNGTNTLDRQKIMKKIDELAKIGKLGIVVGTLD